MRSLRAAIALAWLAALVACAAPPKPAPAVTLAPLADGVWLHTSSKDVPPWGSVLSHGLVVATPEGALVVDTTWDDASTETLLAEARRVAGARVRAVVATHAHDDKMGGMRAVRAAGIRSYAHAFSNADAPARGLAPASDVLFADGSRDFALAGVEVFHPGAGHTRDNLVVYVPSARVLFGGCLVRPGAATDLGNVADGDVAHWAEAVRAVAARFPDARIVVPSHGAAGGRELLAHTLALAEKAARR
jgi:metallo-beta-lactamase class B